MKKIFRKTISILIIISLTVAIFGCTNSDEENNEHPELLSVEELGTLNKTVKDGETSIEETLEIYKKMIARNLTDEGRNILGNAVAGETLGVLKKQIDEALNNDFSKGVEILGELVFLNPDEELENLLTTELVSKAEELFEESRYEEAYETIEKRFQHGFDMDHMALKIEMGLKLIDSYLKDKQITKAKNLTADIKSILLIKSNETLKEKYLDKILEFEQKTENL